jgi:hypothetical protein
VWGVVDGWQDGLGALKPQELLLGKRMLAERFFRTHK